MKNFFARIIGSIRHFVKILSGYQNSEDLGTLIGNTNVADKALEEKIDSLARAINKYGTDIYNGLDNIFRVLSQRPIVPIIMNEKGYFLNLAIEKKAKLEVISDGDICHFKLVVDHTHTFFDISVDMREICVRNMENKDFADTLPIMQHARVLLKNGEKKGRLLERIGAVTLSKLLVRSQHQVIDINEAYYLCADTIISVVKPIYEDRDNKEKKLDPIEREKALRAMDKERRKGVRVLSDDEKNGVNIQEPKDDKTDKYIIIIGNGFLKGWGDHISPILTEFYETALIFLNKKRAEEELKRLNDVGFAGIIFPVLDNSKEMMDSLTKALSDAQKKISQNETDKDAVAIDEEVSKEKEN